MAEGPRMTAAQLHVLADANSYRFLVWSTLFGAAVPFTTDTSCRALAARRAGRRGRR
jgi:hypothetical protein